MSEFFVNKFNAHKFFIAGFLLALLMIFLDLLSKNAIYSLLHNSQSTLDNQDVANYSEIPRKITLTSFFSLIYVNNKGISFGMFNNINNAKEIFVILQGSIALSLLIWLWRVKEWHMAIALGLIIGGAFGNVFDRMQNGGVTDFLDFHIASYHWPAFNLADSVIFIGVALILFDEFIVKKK